MAVTTTDRSRDTAREPIAGAPSFGAATKAAFAVIALLLAALSGVAAFSASIGRSVPEATLDLWPGNGWIEARAANGRLARAALANDQTVPDVLPTDIRDLAVQSVLHEPLSATGIYILGLGHQAEPGKKRARELIQLSNKITRRNSGANFWLTQDYAERGDRAAALRSYDVLMRTNTRISSAVLPAMAKMLAVDGAVDEFHDLLRKDPPWQDDFWAAVIQDGSAFEGAHALRLMVHDTPITLQPHHDGLLIAGLAKSGQIEKAISLYEAATQQGEAGGSELLTNPSFEVRPQFGPIDWRLISEERFGAEYDPGAKGVGVTALGGAQGTIMQQLIALRPGKFRISIEVEETAGMDLPSLTANLRCAEAGAPVDITVPLASGAGTFDYSGSCRYAWFSVVMPEVENRLGAGLLLRSVSLKPADSKIAL